MNHMLESVDIHNTHPNMILIGSFEQIYGSISIQIYVIAAGSESIRSQATR